MGVVVQILFFVTAFAMLHTYIFYPLLLFARSRTEKNTDGAVFTETSDLPELAIICAAYNEEKVIEEKIRSTFDTSYPKEKIQFLIGTDNCSDNTVALIRKLQATYPALQLVEFTQRTGKIGILNDLCSRATQPVLIMTDANVYFTRDTLFELAKHFKDTGAGLVCGHISKRKLDEATVTKNELQYMNFENNLKYAESKLWNIVMGAEGGCYAIRREFFKPVPANFNVDDFFITCLVLRQKKKIVYEKGASALEFVATDTRSEFRRKARIATGNFQNLFYFKDLLANVFSATGFAFLSHKVLRWFTPFLFLFNFACCALLVRTHFVFELVFFTELFFLVAPFLNYVLVKLHLKVPLLISLSHFMVMNAALFVGLMRYSKGVGSSVWEPVKR